MTNDGPVLVAGDHDNGRRGTLGAQKEETGEAAHARHGEIEQHEIRVGRPVERGDHAVEIMRDRDLRIWRGGDDRFLQAANHERMVVRD